MRFSAIVNTHNRCEYALEAIQSVLNQTYPVHETIVICDGCTDDTAQRVREKFPDVTVFEQPDLGRSVARNTGISLATGEWICFLDDDDLWHRDKLATIVEYHQKNPTALAMNHPAWYFSNEENGPDHYVCYARDLVAHDLDECHRLVENGLESLNSYEYLKVKGNSFGLVMESARGIISSSVVQRDLLVRAGGFCPMQSYGEDWTMFLNVARLTEWHTIPRWLGFARLHSSQSTNKNECANMVHILAGKVNAWYTGCPMQQPLGEAELRRELKKYGPVYRADIQSYYWTALRSRDLRSAKIIWSLGKLLLPSGKDRAYALTPPPLTWRCERLASKLHVLFMLYMSAN